MNLNDIRRKYLNYTKKNGHAIIPSASLVPENDPTTLFTGSGMQPLVPYLLGEKHPMGTKLADSQKCFRAEDIEEVGDNRHTTFFEMLGNWSLGEYFKEEQIRWFWKFLIEELHLDPTRIFVTCYSGDPETGIGKDTESAGIWKELFARVGIEAKELEIGDEAQGYIIGERDARIFYYSDKNWWSRAGAPKNMPIGEPGGPDTEVFYLYPNVEHDKKWGERCHLNCDCGRYIELGNSVFMQYIKTKDGFENLPKRNVDYGGGLERLTAAVNDSPDIFLANYAPIIEHLERESGKKYGIEEKQTRAFRIIADHMKATVFLVADGVYPGNVGQGYFVRRLIRRAVRYADQLGISEGVFKEIVVPIAKMYEEAYPYVLEKISVIENVIMEEEMKFRKTLEKGLKEFEKRASRGQVDGKDAFVLFSTYGFPMEMTEELAIEHGIEIDREEYEGEFARHRTLSRTASAGTFKGGLADASEKTTALHTSTHLMLAGLRKYLGEHVHQAGSNITAERTRFDFTHPEKVDRKILDEVEKYVNEAIEKGCHVRIEEMDKEVAKKSGVEGSFWEKYPERVHVYIVESDDGMVYSRELCGGPHVESTSNIHGTFRIIKEQSSSAGVRRIKAIIEE